jgi:hypothetical protein
MDLQAYFATHRFKTVPLGFTCADYIIAQYIINLIKLFTYNVVKNNYVKATHNIIKYEREERGFNFVVLYALTWPSP